MMKKIGKQKNDWQGNTLPQTIKPFLSLSFLIVTLLTLVFLQMEERRMGYLILKLEREQRTLLNQKRMREVQLAKLTKPQHVEKLAHRHLTLRRAQSHQVIHMNTF